MIPDFPITRLTLARWAVDEFADYDDAERDLTAYLVSFAPHPPEEAS